MYLKLQFHCDLFCFDVFFTSFFINRKRKDYDKNASVSLPPLEIILKKLIGICFWDSF